MTSPFANFAAGYREQGLAVLPCGPGTKFPGRYSSADGWFPEYNWQKYCDRLPSHFEMDVWDRWPDGGICLALGTSSAPSGMQLIAMDIDTEDSIEVAAIRAVLPGSPVRKRGAKGETEFYLAPASVPNRPYNDRHKRRMLDLLGHGRQTVLPPTIHPDTGAAYRWTTLDTLETFEVRDLPVLPADIADILDGALAPFGHVAPPPPVAGADGEGEVSTHRELNDTALGNLAAWVPSLGLYKCRQVGGKYKAVAHWRSSSGGRALADRATNLIISPAGIKDKGAEKGYTPLDLVMAAWDEDLDTAFRWLQERVAPAAVITLTANVPVDVPGTPGPALPARVGNLAGLRLATFDGVAVQPGGDDEQMREYEFEGSLALAPRTEQLSRLPGAGLVAVKGVTAAQLLQMDFPPIKWVVPGFLVEGLTLFAGAPKIGKSWMALGLAHAVASGGKAFGTIDCEQGHVLYLALEDNQRRIASRLRHMGLRSGPEALDIMVQWPTVDEDCVRQIEIWIDQNPSARMVVVDVFAKIKSSKGGNKPQYDVDYKDVTTLQHLAINRGIAIVLVHHTRKLESEDPFDAVSGTRGLTGSADSTFVLTRGIGQVQPKLYGRGRDIEEVEKEMEFDAATGRWTIGGPVIALASSPERQAILNVLKRAVGPMALSDISETVEKSKSTVRNMLKKMIDDGSVSQPASGMYEICSPRIMPMAAAS